MYQVKDVDHGFNAYTAIADALSFSANKSATDPGPTAKGVEPKIPADQLFSTSDSEGLELCLTEESEPNEASHRGCKRTTEREGKS